MKKILSLLAAIGLTSTAASSVISCAKFSNSTVTNKPKQRVETKTEKLERLAKELQAKETLVDQLLNEKKELNEASLSNANKHQELIDEIKRVEAEANTIKEKIDEAFSEANLIKERRVIKLDEISKLNSSIKEVVDKNEYLQGLIDINDADLIYVKNLIPKEKEADPVLIKVKNDLEKELDVKRSEYKVELEKLNEISQAGDSIAEQIKSIERKLLESDDVAFKIDDLKESIRGNQVQQDIIIEGLDDAKNNKDDGAIAFFENKLQKLENQRKLLEERYSVLVEDEKKIDEYKKKKESLRSEFLANKDKQKVQREILNKVQTKIDFLKADIAEREIQIKESYENYFERNKSQMDYFEKRQKEIKQRAQPHRDRMAENDKQIISYNAEISKAEDFIKHSDEQLKDYDFLLNKLNSEWNILIENKNKLEEEKESTYKLVDDQLTRIKGIDFQIKNNLQNIEDLNYQINQMR